MSDTPAGKWIVICSISRIPLVICQNKNDFNVPPGLLSVISPSCYTFCGCGLYLVTVILVLLRHKSRTLEPCSKTN